MGAGPLNIILLLRDLLRLLLSLLLGFQWVRRIFRMPDPVGVAQMAVVPCAEELHSGAEGARADASSHFAAPILSDAVESHLSHQSQQAVIASHPALQNSMFRGSEFALHAAGIEEPRKKQWLRYLLNLSHEPAAWSRGDLFLRGVGQTGRFIFEWVEASSLVVAADLCTLGIWLMAASKILPNFFSKRADLQLAYFYTYVGLGWFFVIDASSGAVRHLLFHHRPGYEKEKPHFADLLTNLTEPWFLVFLVLDGFGPYAWETEASWKHQVALAIRLLIPTAFTGLQYWSDMDPTPAKLGEAHVYPSLLDTSNNASKLKRPSVMRRANLNVPLDEYWFKPWLRVFMFFTRNGVAVVNTYFFALTRTKSHETSWMSAAGMLALITLTQGFELYLCSTRHLGVQEHRWLKRLVPGVSTAERVIVGQTTGMFFVFNQLVTFADDYEMYVQVFPAIWTINLLAGLDAYKSCKELIDGSAEVPIEDSMLLFRSNLERDRQQYFEELGLVLIAEKPRAVWRSMADLLGFRSARMRSIVRERATAAANNDQDNGDFVREARYEMFRRGTLFHSNHPRIQSVPVGERLEIGGESRAHQLNY